MPSIPTVTAAASPPSAPPSTPPVPRWRLLLRIVLGTLLGVWSLLLLAWLILHWGILNHIERWRPDIESRASELLGVSVQIGHIDASTSGWIPAITLREVVLRDGAGREALRLPRVAAALSPQSLVALRPRLSQLLIEGAALEVRRDASGAVMVAGIPLSQAPGSGDTAAADWFFEQSEFVLRGGSLRWVDERRGTPPLELRDLQFVARHHLHRHELRLDATPPPGWGERFSVQARFERPLLARPGALERWSGELQASLPQVDLGLIGAQLPLPTGLTRGHGSLRAWLTLEAGQPQALTLDLALRDVLARLGPTLEPLALAEVAGRIVARRDGDRLQLEARRFGFVTGDGLPWPAGDLSLSWHQPRSPKRSPRIEGGTLTADRLDLDLLARLARRVPLGEPQRRALTALAPRGIVQDLQARWDGPPDALREYQVRARVAGLSIAPGPAPSPTQPGRPGVRNANVEFEASERGGTARLSLRDGQLYLPGVLAAEAVPLSTFRARLDWTVGPPAHGAGRPALELRVRDARFANADARGRFEATWRSAPAAASPFPGRIELDGQLDSLPVARLPDYLPLRLDAGLRAYLAGAFGQGRLDDTRFRLRGDLARFPFEDPADGELRVSSRLSQARLDVAPPLDGAAPTWPALEDLAGELVFEQRSMRIVGASARVQGVQLAGVQGHIASLSREAVLELEGGGLGPATGVLDYVRLSPIGRRLDGVLDQARASGQARLRLGLSIPLLDASHTRVRGEIALDGSELQLHPHHPRLAGLQGLLRFTERDFSIVDTQAQVFGGSLRFAGGSQPDGGVRLEGEGQASAEGLRQAAELGAVSRLAAAFSGQTAYRLALELGRGLPQLQLSSDLGGLAIDLPAPLDKPAQAAWPLRIETRLEPVDAGSPGLRDTLSVQLGGRLQAQYRREHDPRGPTRVLAGGIALQAPLRLPPQGVHAELAVDHVDLDAWRRVFARWQPADAGDVGAAAAAAAAERSAYLPQTVSLQAGLLALAGQQANRLKARLRDEDGLWRMQIEADELLGRVDFLPPGTGGRDGLLRARLDRLVLRPAAVTGAPLADGAELPPAASNAPVQADARTTRVPALDIVVEDLVRGGRHLGRLEVMAVHRPSAGGPALSDWQLDMLRLTSAEARLEASGHWKALPQTPGAVRRSVMDFELDVQDSGALLERFGHAGLVQGGRGRLSGQLAWQGSPLAPDLASLDGSLQLAVGDGRFLKADPGAARLLGVLSLQALPRRLMLDFRDVFGEGFAFDRVEGDVRIEAGVARTRNLRLRGVQAAVLLEGEASLAQETQDLRVVVVPELNAGTASLAYAVINPVVGLGTFVAQWLMRKPMMAASTREFRVHGPWADPRVDRIETRLPTAEAEGAAAADGVPMTSPAAGAAAPGGGSGAPAVAEPPAPAAQASPVERLAAP